MLSTVRSRACSHGRYRMPRDEGRSGRHALIIREPGIVRALPITQKEVHRMKQKTFMVLSAAGPARDLTKGTREQRYWDEHAAFIDGLVDEGFILLGGPLSDEG